MASKRTVWILSLMLLISMVLFCYILYADEGGITVIDVNGYNTDDTMKWCVDEIEIKNDILKIKGWIVKPGEAIEVSDIAVALVERESDKCLELPTQTDVRTDVTNYMNDDLNYDYSGYESVTIFDKNNLDTGTYEVVLLYRCNDEKIIMHTGDILDRGKVIHGN